MFCLAGIFEVAYVAALQFLEIRGQEPQERQGPVHGTPDEMYLVHLGSGEGPHAWLRDNEALWSLVLPVTEARRVKELPSHKHWHEVRDEVGILLESSQLGAKLFSHAGAEVVGAQVLAIISEQIQQLKAKSHLAETDVIQSRIQALDKIRELSTINMLEG